MMYREEYYKPDTTEKGIAEVIVGKHRNGPTGTVKLTFLGEYTRFENHQATGQFYCGAGVVKSRQVLKGKGKKEYADDDF
jgi:hypothetical protein